MNLISAAGSGGTNRLIENYKNNFIGITADKYKLYSSVLDKNYLVPSASNNNYIDKVNNIIQEENIDLFIPNSDAEVFYVTKNIDKIKSKTFLPDFDIVEKTFDKLDFYLFAKKKGVKVAETFHIKDNDDIKEAFSKLSQRPLWCRSRRGSGSRYTSKVISIEDASWYIKHQILFNELPKDEFLISEYLPGDDIAVMTIWKEGNIKLCKMAKRTRYFKKPGESAPNILESFFDTSIEEFVIESIKKLTNKANGLLNVDIKCNNKQEPVITEINSGRFYYNMPLFNSGKFNAFEIFLKLANNIDVKYSKEDPEVVFIREQDNPPYIVSKRIVYENR